VILNARRTRILDTLAVDGAASVRELAEILDVSESTIRRDLQQLDRNGELVRTYGGAVVPPRATTTTPGDPERLERPWSIDNAQESELKAAIGAAAAALVQDEQVVLLDIGTTTPFVARALRGRPVTVITSNVAVLDELREDDAVRVVMLGGVLRRNYQSLVGSLTQSALEQISADIVFLSCTGVRENGVVVDNMAVEAPIKQKMIETSDTTVLLASAHKFPGTGSLRLCSVADVDVLITTDGANARTTALCRDAGGKVVIA
jgi:DeoR/GlpR family transcriptional regulator of sugar metabolism